MACPVPGSWEWEHPPLPDDLCEDDVFARAWEWCEDQSWCDGWGGIECCRVYAEWVRAGRPDEIEAFIHERANIGPTG